MAIQVIDNFKNAMKAPVKVIGADIFIADGDTYSSEDSLVKTEIQSSGYFFGVSTKTASITLLGMNYTLLNKSLSINLRVLSSAGSWLNCMLGQFQVTEQTTDLERGMTTIKAYDAIGMAALKPYSAGDMNPPITINALASRIASNCSMEYDDTTELLNGNYVISEDLYANISDVTYRDVLAEVAGATASLASVHGANSTLTFTQPTNQASETWTYANLKKVKLEPKYGEVNSVVISRTPQEDNIVASDDESIEANELTEVKLANNEIMDNARETFAQPILDAVKGFYFYPFEATTEGHGWHEVGDRITVSDGVNSWDVIVTDIKLTIDGSLKEVIKGVAPTETTTNFALAGGITKTIYNTEIKVDKQNQEITSIVSKQESLENETKQEFSQIVQNINSITTTIQTTGGSNLIRNSVGYNATADEIVNWEKTGNVATESSPESVSYGATSANQIDLSASSSITQRVSVDNTGSAYSLSFRAKKGATGVATVHLRNSVDDYTVAIPAGKEALWETFNITAVTPHDVYFDVVIETDSDTSYYAITDLILNIGDATIPWTSAVDEILSRNVAVDSHGVIVRSSTTNDSVRLDEQGLRGFSDASGIMEEVFAVNRDVTYTSKLRANKQISMTPIKIVPITSGPMAGWSFVQIGDNE